MKPTAARWKDACSLAELSSDALTTWKPGEAQLVLGVDEGGAPFALDNRCPHEGYPLAQGDVKGCLLTCAWHNWKFDVRDGSCVLGGEDVRRYPVRVRDGRVEVDLAQPDPSTFFRAWKESLETGLFRYENGRAIRDGVRLLQGGYDPVHLLADVARYDALHAEYGTTHVLAVAADCARVLGRYPGTRAMVPVAPVIDQCGDSNRRLPERPRPEPLAEPAGGFGPALRAAVEGEEAERAEGLLRGAFRAGVPATEIEGWLYAVLSDHFLDFGHPLIYLVKGQELFDRAGREHAEAIWGALLHGIVLGTREDTLPYWSGYTRRLREIEPELASVRTKEGSPLFDPGGLRDAALDGSIDEAFDAVWNPLREGVAPVELARALVGAAARRLFRYDLDIEWNHDLAEGWLWATHRFTFASAVRNAVQRSGAPDALRFLFQALAFVHSGRRMDAPPEERLPLERTPMPAGEIVQAIGRRDPERAVAGTLAALDDVHVLAELRGALEDLCLHDPAVRPVVTTHAIKTTFAAFEETEALSGHPDRDWPLVAAVRFLASPRSERSLQGTVHTSLRWVRDGVVPRKLTQ